MNYSQNYNLKLPENADSYSVSDFNDNFSTVDSQIYNVANNSDANAYDIYNLQLNQRILENKINTLKTIYDYNATPESDFEIVQPEVYDGTCSVFGYKGNDIKIKIPHVINGLLVTGISYYFGTGTTAAVEEIEIPFTVEQIANTAFIGLQDLIKITFEQGSQLKFIGSQIFDTNANIRELRIPNTIEVLCMNAFYGCSIDEIIFDGTENLTSIDTEGTGHPGSIFPSQANIYENGGEIKDYIDDNSLSNHYYTLVANDKTLSRILQEIRIGSQSIQNILNHYGI